MAEPKTDTRKSPEGKAPDGSTNAPPDELAVARARIAELERSVTERDEQLDASRARITELERIVTERDDELVAAHRTHAHKERALEEALTRARHAPAEHLAGEVVRMRARHTLYFSGTSGPCKALAGREFDASHEELMRAELVEGRDFERVTG